MQETRVQSLSPEDPLGKRMARILGWSILWTQEPAGLQSMGSQISSTECNDRHTLLENLAKHLPVYLRGLIRTVHPSVLQDIKEYQNLTPFAQISSYWHVHDSNDRGDI